MIDAINNLPPFWQGVLSSIVGGLVLALLFLLLKITFSSIREWLAHRSGAIAVLRQQLSATQPSIRTEATVRVFFGMAKWLVISALLFAFSTVSLIWWPQAISLGFKVASMVCLVVSLGWLYQYQRPARSEPADWEEALVKGKWTLVYNPPNRSKPITFLATGAIGEGQNQNENRWRVSKGKLELLQSDGQTHSRFEFNPRNSSFVHTNDEDTKSIKGQYILPARNG